MSYFQPQARAGEVIFCLWLVLCKSAAKIGSEFGSELGIEISVGLL
jgi:hypothetical protein